MTQYISLIGYPVKHSISPEIQQAALDYYKLDICYQARETKAEELAPTINQLRQLQNIGANITVPYKEKVLKLLDEIDDQAGFCGAVNTIVNKDGILKGFNTDGYGFIKALRKEGNFDPQNKNVILIGAGGVARSVSFALIQDKVASLTIANRTLNRAESIVESLTKYTDDKKLHVKISALPLGSSEFKEIIKSSHLIVNCTTLGMRHSAQERQSPLGNDSIPPNALIYDLVYNPSQTPLLQIAKEAGARTLNGLPMLVYQGAAAFELWTKKIAPVDIMFSIAKAAMNGL